MSRMSGIEIERHRLEALSNKHLKQEFALYSELHSRGVRDEIVLMLLETELARREAK